MALLRIPGIREGKDIEQLLQNVLDAYARMSRELENFSRYIDSDNVTQLNTQYTKISSDRGETEIQGPLLIMKDKQGTPVIRLKMGYDKDSTDFVHQLMNATGDITVSLDSSGNLVVERGTFKGSITIGTGNDVFKAGDEGIWLGHAEYAEAPFKVSKAGAATATNLTVIGGVIKGGKFRNDDESMEISFSGDEFRVLKVGSTTTIFSVSESGGTTYVSADGAANIMAITGENVIAYGNWTFNGDTWGVFGNSDVQQSAANITKATAETPGAAYTANEQAMLGNLKSDVTQLFNTVNGVIDKLQKYGIFSEG